MAYNNNIPLPTDQLSVSQADLLNNFIALQSLIDVNHVDFAAAGAGKHKWVTFPVQAVAPATGATEVALYCKTSTLTGNPELFFRNFNSGSENEFTSYSATQNGWTRLPSGILIKWGNGVATGATVATYPVAGTIPVFNNVYNAQVTVVTQGANIDANMFVTVNSYTTTQINLFGSARTTNAVVAVPFRYLIIGD